MDCLTLLTALLIPSTAAANPVSADPGIHGSGGIACRTVAMTCMGDLEQGMVSQERPSVSFSPRADPVTCSSSCDLGVSPDLTSSSEDNRLPPSGHEDSYWFRMSFLSKGMHAMSDQEPGQQNPDTLFAMNTVTGEVLWMITGADFSCSTLLIKNGRLYITRDGSVLCLDAFTGEVVWHFGNSCGSMNDPFLNVSAVQDAVYYPSESVTLGYGTARDDEDWSTVVRSNAALSSAPDAPDMLSGTKTNDDDHGGPMNYRVGRWITDFAD